jgi:hypothetical protein
MKRFPTPLRGSLPERLVGSLRYVIFHGSSVKNGRKLVRRRHPWISLVIPLSPAYGKSSRPNEPSATYCPVKAGKEHERVDSKPSKILYSKKTRAQGSKFRNHDNGNKNVRTNALEFFGLTPLRARE